MSYFEKNKNLLDGKGEDNMQWITANGSHIPLKDGENPKEAIEKRVETKNAPTDNNNQSEYKNKIKYNKEELKQLVNNIISLKPIEIKMEDKKITASFDKYGAKKNVYGLGRSDIVGFDYKLKNIDNLPSYIQTSQYDHSSKETGKSSQQHKGVKEWHYFINEIETDKGTFNITVNVRDKGTNQFIYEVAFNKKKT